MINVSCAFPERKIRAALRQVIFHKGRVHCTHCGYFRIIALEKEQRYFCKRCRRKFSLLSGTWLRNIKVPLSMFLLLLCLWLEDYQIKQARQLTRVSIPTIRKYFRLFRLHIVKTLDFRPQKHVQVDEAYFGQFKKMANYFHGHRTYKVVEKTCVAGIGCPATGELATMVVEGKPGKPIKEFIYQQVPTSVRVYSDGSHIYTNLRKDYRHISRTHDLGFHYAYYIESCWSWMKRKLFKQYHHFTRKYAKEYVSELTFKFNTRKLDKNPFEYLAKSF
jgi:transposase-like protein